ncbi:MAG TPA: class I SAM-dependent methyltransferase [Pyrinomonadaceae bacterium]|nr:class I SAM-dependent methyltransferase [Pyrinomonadaceae bacterium]
MSTVLRKGTSHEVNSAHSFEAERLQLKHYDEIAADYDAHYSDAQSCEYRRRFFYEPMFEGIALAGTEVLDAMCGSGQTTEYLLKQSASVTGLDISNQTMESYQAKWPAAKALRRSLLDSELPEASFDCICVVGGLHHVHPHVPAAVAEIHRLLKPRGYFCFMEPHSGSLPDVIRKFWYKHDHYFSDNEAAIDLNDLERQFSSRFSFHKVKYQGNLAFLLVLNSLIFRIPPRLKPFYSGPLISLEAVISRFQTKLTSCFVVAQWQKKL